MYSIHTTKPEIHICLSMKVLIRQQKNWASALLRNSSPTKTKSIQRLKKSHHFSNSMNQNARGLQWTPTKLAKYYPLHSGGKSPHVSMVRWWSPAKAKHPCMVRLHVFSIKVSTPSCMAWSALIISKFHVSKHVSNRHTKVVPQPEWATTAIPRHC